MVFPDAKFGSAGAYFDAYAKELARAAASVDRAALDEAARIIDGAIENGGTIYVCGNGGSAAIANHLICDFAKGIQTDTDALPRVVSLSDNIEIITAIANDIAYEEVFAYQLRTMARPGDMLIAISSSGNSENILRALRWANDHGLPTVAITGFAGGGAADLGTVSLHIAAENYGVVEDLSQAIMHCLAHYLRQTRMPEELIAERKF